MITQRYAEELLRVLLEREKWLAEAEAALLCGLSVTAALLHRTKELSESATNGEPADGEGDVAGFVCDS